MQFFDGELLGYIWVRSVRLRESKRRDRENEEEEVEEEEKNRINSKKKPPPDARRDCRNFFGEES